MSDKWKLQNQPCPMCTSSDAFSIDVKDWGHCFSCGGNKYVGEGTPQHKQQEVPLTQAQSQLYVGGVHRDVPERKITKPTMEFFDVKIIEDRNYVMYPFYSEDKELIAQKGRNLENKKLQSWRGDVKAATLFGQNKWSTGRSITITEGEWDAMAVYEMAGPYPVVSIKNGSDGAEKDVRNNLAFFKNFQTVYICFDADEPGRKAANKVASLFPIGKAKIVHLDEKYNDANGYLIAGKNEAFKKAWWDAVPFTPAGIESAAKGGVESLFDDIDGLELYPYPFGKLNEATFGIRTSEMVMVVAGSGVGKSAAIGEIAFKLLNETPHKVGMMMLEESVKKTKLRMMSIYLNKPLHLSLMGRLADKFSFLKTVLDKTFEGDDWAYTDDSKKEINEAWANIIEKKAHDGEQQLWLFSHFGSNDIDTIVSRIRDMVVGIGCKFIFLDHISIVVSEQQNGDERKALDELATKLRTLVAELDFSLIAVAHLRRPGGKPHEEGGETSLSDIRGTAGIGQLSDIVIGLERNGQHPDPFLSNITKFRVLKNRFAGITGLTSFAEYSNKTGRLTEISKEEVEAYEKSLDGPKVNDEDDKSVFDNSKFGSEESEREKKSFNGQMRV